MDPVQGNLSGIGQSSPGIHSINFSPEPSLKGVGSDSDIGSQLEGDITIPGQSNTQTESTDGEFNTLDEPIMNTIKRDLKAVGQKLLGALMPSKSKNLLIKDWDLWGPLLLTTYIGLMLQTINSTDTSGYQFTEIFIVVCLGTAALTYSHVVIAGAPTSMLQCVCVLGYCLGPLALAVSLFEIMGLFGVLNGTLFFRLLISIIAGGWSAYAATSIMKTQLTDKLSAFHFVPATAYYFSIALVILWHSGPWKQ